MPAAIVHINLADAGSVTASSWIASAPPDRLQNAHTRRRWKGRNGDAEFVRADLGEVVEFDTFALLGCAIITTVDEETEVEAPMNSSAITRIRVSAFDPTALTAEIYDSGAEVGNINEAYSTFVKHLETPLLGRYVRIDITHASADAILAGRLVIGLRHEFERNFAYGWSFGYGDLSRFRVSAGGQTFVDRDDRYRVLNITLEGIERDERFDFVDDVDRLNGISSDILFILDPESDRPDRDSIWGLLTDNSPASQSNFVFFSKTYSLKERL